jgi:hypothetical protein
MGHKEDIDYLSWPQVAVALWVGSLCILIGNF